MAHQRGHFHIGPVLLDYSRSHAAGRLENETFNDYGFVVRARTTTGEDFHLWLFTYQLKGAEVIIDGDVTQTLLLYDKFSPEQKKTIRDNEYVNKGQNLEDYLPSGSIKISEEKDIVSWDSGAG